jgi:hypothetical protein
MRTRLIAIAALVSASTLAVAAQAPPPQEQRPPQQRPVTPTTPPTTGDTTQRAATDQVITIAGCLKEEKDVPGRKPNAAERAGITEDYILTNVKMAQSSAVSGIGVGSMYEIEGIAEAELKKHLNHQVEITGKITQTTTAARAGDDVPDFQATSLKMVSATCPAM